MKKNVIQNQSKLSTKAKTTAPKTISAMLERETAIPTKIAKLVLSVVREIV